MIALIGWVSSLILIATVARQVQRQWRERSTAGVSRWLFVGNLAASIGFLIYSVLLRNWVYVVTNALMVANCLAGALIFRRNRRLTGS